MKKYSTPIKIISSLWVLPLIFIPREYSEYSRYYLYGSITIMIPFMIFNLIKQKKEDKLNGTESFRQSIYRMLIVSIVLGIFYFITMQSPV